MESTGAFGPEFLSFLDGLGRSVSLVSARAYPPTITAIKQQLVVMQQSTAAQGFYRRVVDVVWSARRSASADCPVSSAALPPVGSALVDTGEIPSAQREAARDVVEGFLSSVEFIPPPAMRAML